MANYLDSISPDDIRNADFDKYFFSLPENERKRLFKSLQKVGFEAPTEDNVFVEAGQAFSQSLVSAGRGLGATFNELGMGSGVQDYFTGVLRRNQHWNAPADMGTGTYISRALGSGVGSTVGVLGASTAGGLINPAVGLGAGLTTGFAQSFGDNVQRNRAAGYSEGKAYGMAFLESAVDTGIENLPFGVVGKSAKSLGILKNLSESGKKEFVNLVGQKLAEKVGQKEAQNLLMKWGRKTLESGAGESFEEGLQYFNSYLNQELGGDPNAKFSKEELADAMAQGFIGGFGMGGVMNIAEVRNKSRRGVTDPVSETVPAASEGFAETSVSDPATSEDFDATSLSDVLDKSDMSDKSDMEAEATPSLSEDSAEQSVDSLSDEVIRGVAEEFGVKVDYVDNYNGEKKIAEDATGFFDKSTNTIYLGRDARDDLGVTLGHEFKHFLDKEHADLVKGFDAIWESGQTEAGKKYFQKLVKDWGLTEDIKQKEFSAEVFGKIFVRPETWRSYAENLERQTPGLGEKFVKVLQQFIQAIKKRLSGLGELAEQSPEAEVLFNNVSELEAEAGRILAEVRMRKHGAKMQMESDAEIATNTTGEFEMPEFVDVDSLGIDVDRFQFKENKDKKGVVVPLSGDFDQQVARPVFVWEDKSGKRFIVEGHHRLDLAKRTGNKKILAYVHKESDGKTAEWARRRGVMMNIQDNKGSVKDFAEFFRNDDITYEEAKERGLFRKGENGEPGFIIGKYSGDLLYSAFRNDSIKPEKAEIIADAARGDEGLEAAGLKKANGMSKEHLAEYMRLLKKLPREKSVQGDLFGFDDSAIQEADKISELALRYQKKLKLSINSGKGAIKRPEAASEVGVYGDKDSVKKLAQAQEELYRYEHYDTDPEIYQKLLKEAGLSKEVEGAGKSDVSDKSDPASSKDYAETSKSGAANVKSEIEDSGRFNPESETPLLSAEEDANDFQLVAESKEDAVKAEKEAQKNEVRQQEQAKEEAEKQSADLFAVGEDGKSDVSDGSDVSDDTNVTPEKIKKSVFEDFHDRKSEIGFSFDEFYSRFSPQEEAIIAKNVKSFKGNKGNLIEDRFRDAANNAMTKAYMNYDPSSGSKIDTLAHTYIVNAITDVKRKLKSEGNKTNGIVSIDQTTEDGKSIAEFIPDEKASAVPKDESKTFEQKFAEWESKLTGDDKKIFDLYKMGNTAVKIATELGGNWTAKKVKDRFKKITDDARKEISVISEFESKLNDDDRSIINKKNTGKSASVIARELGGDWTTEKVRGRLKELYAAAKDAMGIDYRKKLHNQINPVVVDGHVREEYADLLSKKEYTPTTLKALQDKAMDWIVKQGGIVQAADAIIHNNAPSNTAVAEIVRRYILNSNVYANDVSYEDRVKLNKIEMNERSRAGLTLRSMRLDSLNLDDVASVQALLDKLHENMPSEEVRKLRDDIKKKTGIDIFKIDQKVVDDKSQLDALLRAELAHKSSWGDKLYEYWINSILSGPTTHVANFAGNTANAVYELGIKRFTEALVNTVAGRKDGATFQEFKEMSKAFNWKNAQAAFLRALDIEALDPSGKFMENRTVAIGGKLGRGIRMPGRLLAAADAMAKAIIEPMETVAYACRIGVQQGYSGQDLQKYIQDQLTDSKSVSYQWGKQRAKELAFQEDPGYFVNRLMTLRETPGYMGAALRIVLPFIKTPTNILRQGARKSVLGSFGLVADTISRIKNKRGFDGAYVARAAEQIIAWGTLMAFYALDDDDELPIITGSSAPYGSAEYGFKANKIPPYSIRIGDKWFSYKRIEPMSTGLALIADTLQALKNAKNGKDGEAIIRDLFRGGGQIFLEKSFLDGLGEISKAIENPSNFSRAVVNPVKGLIPNLFTQMRQSFDENVQDTKSREKGIEWFKDQFFMVMNRAGITTALPKVDYFGRDVKKDDWGDESYTALWRILGVQRMDADSSVDQAERLILNYNQKNPDESWYPSIPQPTFKRNGQKYYFSGENYTNFAKDAGALAHKQIKNAISAGRLNVNNPSKADIDLMKKVFTRARKETLDKHIKNAKTY